MNFNLSDILDLMRANKYANRYIPSQWEIRGLSTRITILDYENDASGFGRPVAIIDAVPFPERDGTWTRKFLPEQIINAYLICSIPRLIALAKELLDYYDRCVPSAHGEGIIDHQEYVDALQAAYNFRNILLLNRPEYTVHKTD